MGLFSFFTRFTEPEQSAPDQYDALAVIARVAAIKERSFAFYQKHRPLVEECLEFVRSIRNHDRELGLLLGATDGPFARITKQLRKRAADSSRAAELRPLISNGIETLLPRFAPLWEDTSHPRYLDDCAWVVRAVADPADSSAESDDPPAR